MPENTEVNLEELFGDNVPENLEVRITEQCDICRDDTSRLHLMTNAVLVCSDCFNNGPIVFCVNCRGAAYVHDIGSWWRGSIVGGGMPSVCNSCLQTDGVDVCSCSFCDDEWPTTVPWVDVLYSLPVQDDDGTFACPSCSNTRVLCDFCNCWITGNQIRVYDGRRQRVYTSCDGCLSDDAEMCRDCNQRFISVCSCFREAIRSWNYTPSQLQILLLPAERLVDDQLTYGFEVELGCQNSHDGYRMAKWVDKNQPWLYCCSDGTIGETGGFEVISHPFSHGWLMSQEQDLRNIFRFLRSRGMMPNNNCGMHVHIRKKSLSAGRIYRMYRLVYQSPYMWERIAQRPNRQHMQSWSQLFLTDATNSNLVEWSLQAQRPNYDQRKAEDGLGNKAIVGRKETLEMRLFGPTAQGKVISSRIDLVHALTVFSRFAPIEVHEVHFLRWISKNRTDFPKAHDLLMDVYGSIYRNIAMEEKK